MTPRSRIVTRLEPGGPSPLREVLAARLYDPLWLLTRQWEFGEFLGEYAGTLVDAEISCTTTELTHLAAKPGALWPAAMTEDRLPPTHLLDALVEAADLGPPPLWRRADGGRLLVALAADAGLPELIEAARADHPLQAPPPDDEDAAALWQLWRAGLPDGGSLRTAIAGLDLSDPEVPLPGRLATAGPAGAVRTVLRVWLQHWTATLPAAPAVAAWDDEALTHRFSIAAASSEATTTFSASHPGGDLDWFRFRAAPPGPPLPGAPAPERRRLRLFPSPSRFPGLPTERWWQVDDNVVDLGAEDAGSADLVRLLVLDYAISYGGDAYVVPLRLPAGSWTTIDSLVVTDCFGDRVSVGTATAPDWTMFTVGETPGLLLVRSSTGRVSGGPTEELILARDELANLAWLIEQRWEGAIGDGVDRQTTVVPVPTRTPADGADVAWRLVDDPPPSWIPMLPAVDAELGPVLKRLMIEGRQPRSGLATDVADALPDRIVPPSGRRVTLRYHSAFDVDGTPLIWAARSTDHAETGSGASGIRWDRADDGTTTL